MSLTCPEWQPPMAKLSERVYFISWVSEGNNCLRQANADTLGEAKLLRICRLNRLESPIIALQL